MRTIRLAAIAALTAALAGAALAHPASYLLPSLLAQTKVNPPKLNKPVPAFSMTDLAGKTHTNKTLLGKVVLLDFWASWCGPCKAASPSMQRLHKELGSKGLVVIGANTFESFDGGTEAAQRALSRKNAAAYQKEHGYGYTFTIFNDKLAESWGISGVPSFYLIDKKGTVVWMSNGWRSTHESTLRTQIRKLLG